jgi:hypothetical protein
MWGADQEGSQPTRKRGDKVELQHNGSTGRGRNVGHRLGDASLRQANPWEQQEGPDPRLANSGNGHLVQALAGKPAWPYSMGASGTTSCVGRVSTLDAVGTRFR